jgi:hypothetical protein
MSCIFLHMSNFDQRGRTPEFHIVSVTTPCLQPGGWERCATALIGGKATTRLDVCPLTGR